MALRRGFKSEAHGIAEEVRAELGLRRSDRLDPLKLAAHLDIPVMSLSDLRVDAPSVFTQFWRTDQSAFSAITVFSGSSRVILHNDSHSRGRQSSNLAHELSHGLLLHPPRPPLDGYGNRDWDPDLEDEANWLAGVLLVPDEAALLIVQRELPLDTAAAIYGVSVAMMTFRLNVSGARQRVQRRAARYGRAG